MSSVAELPIEKAVENRIRAEQGITSDLIKQALVDNEVGDARLFILLHKGRYTFDHAARRWYVFTEHYWEEDRTNAVLAAVESVADLYSGESSRQHDLALSLTKQGKKEAATEAENFAKTLMSRVKTLQTIRRQKNVLELATAGEGSLGISGDEWDSHTGIVGCQNGVIELKTPEPIFRPGAPDDYIKTPVATTWPDEGLKAKAPTFEKFLLETFDGLLTVIDFLARCLGYALQGNPVEDILLTLYGKGRNGKTTLIEALGYVLGKQVGPIRAEMLLVQKQVRSSSGPNSDIMSLRGKKIAWASETDEGRRFNAGRIKHLTGHDTLVGREPYGRREVSFPPTHVLILLTNHKPSAPADDFALWSRLRLIFFPFSFVDEPKKTNERKRDPDLLEKLKAEAPGILVWLVKGWIRYRDEGLIPPDEVKKATAAYQKDQDSIAQFLDAYCIQGPNYQVKVSLIRKVYEKWAEQEGLSPVRLNTFKEYLNERFERTPRTSNGYFYIGLGLTDEGENL
jgi:putative DNA primase/helicase